MAEGSGNALNALFIVCEAILCVLFYFCAEYNPETVRPKYSDNLASVDAEADAFMNRRYPFFQDVHVMIFVGFGFLMVFLKTHSWTSIGFNFMIACWALQVNMLMQPAWHMVLVDGKLNHKIELNIENLITSDFAAGAVLITMGACLGKTTWTQLFILGTLELLFFGFNETVCVGFLKAVDCGGSMYVHTFGAYFGVAASLFFYKQKALKNEGDRCEGVYESELLAMVGTVFLWMYWPSFNGAVTYGAQQERVVMNTVLSISASGLVSVYIALIKLNKFDMEVLLNATLAGGVAIGTGCDICQNPAAAIAVGAIGGAVSALGYLYLNPWIQEKGWIHDTCGVQYLHGIPGIVGAIFGAIFTFTAGSTDGMANLAEREKIFSLTENGRDLSQQGWYQLGALLCTLAVSCIGGAISGLVASKVGGKLDSLFDDAAHFDHVDYKHIVLRKKLNDSATGLRKEEVEMSSAKKLDIN